jgi:hypothetical protein
MHRKFKTLGLHVIFNVHPGQCIFHYAVVVADVGVNQQRYKRLHLCGYFHLMDSPWIAYHGPADTSDNGVVHVFRELTV